MDKLLTVCRTTQGKKYTSSIKIQGDWMKKYGFELGDFVKVEVKKNKIVITKDKHTEIISQMGLKNAALLTMIEGLDLTI